MKEKLIKRIMFFVICVILILGICFFTYKGYMKIVENIRNNNIKDLSWMRENVKLVESDKFGDDIYIIEKPKYVTTYNLVFQKVVKNLIEEKINNKSYTKSSLLIVLNPYYTNATGVNVYYKTDIDESVSYTVSVDDKDISDYTNNLSDGDMEHSYQLIGLVPGYKNSVELKTGDDTYKFSVNLKSVKTQAQTKLDVERVSDEELSSGLYSIQGNDSKSQDFVALYDNDGVLRSEYPIENYRSHKFLFNGDKMYYSISRKKWWK